MTKYVLDAGPLGRIAHANANRTDTERLMALLNANATVFVAEIADYEVRRSLIQAELKPSLSKLDELNATLSYLPLTTEAMRKAAELWAEARNAGQPSAPEEALDCDVVLAAQAILVDAIVITENPGHLARFVNIEVWRNESAVSEG